MKWNRPQSREELLTQLKEQLGFLRTSSELFDLGVTQEAKRLAVAIRVLVHDGKGRSKSLLGQLGLKGRLFRDTAIPFDSRNRLPSWCLIQSLHVAHHDGTMSAKFVIPTDGRGPGREIPFDDWWYQIVFGNGAGLTLSREQLVRAIADQDGGAHVDAAIDAAYAAFSREGATGLRVTNSTGTTIVHGAELAAMRQIAREVLESFEEYEPPRFVESTRHPTVPAEDETVRSRLVGEAPQQFELGFDGTLDGCSELNPFIDFAVSDKTSAGAGIVSSLAPELDRLVSLIQWNNGDGTLASRSYVSLDIVPNIGNRLVTALQSSGLFPDFKADSVRCVGNQASPLTMADLAHWLIVRAALVGGKQAVAEAIQYAHEEKFEFTIALIIKGAQVAKPIQFSNYIWLVPVDQSFVRWVAHPVEYDKFKVVDAALFATVRHPKILATSPEAAATAGLEQTIRSTLNDARYAIGLIRPSVVQGAGVFWRIADQVPQRQNWQPGGWWDVIEGPTISLEASDVALGGRLFQSLTALEDKERRQSRLALGNLQLALRDSSRRDRAIEVAMAIKGRLLREEAVDWGVIDV
jgi:hypothetical protein